MKIIESMITQNRCYTNAIKIQVSGLMLHSVGTSQPNAQVFVNNWNTQVASVSVHAVIDGLTGDVYQTLPWDYKAWHCGPQGGNSHYIGVEMCEPKCIHYSGGGASFTCQDREQAMKTVKRTYDSAVELFAYLCGKYHFDPLADGVIISHREGFRRNVASNHGDPEHLWMGLDSGYTMDGFRRAVAAAMSPAPAEPEPHVEPHDEPHVEPQEKPHEEPHEEPGIQVGSTVVLAPNAVYYDGRLIPGWVKAERWIVKRINGDRVVINENVRHTNAINSAVHIKFLSVAR